jgi:hypothetical protein
VALKLHCAGALEPLEQLQRLEPAALLAEAVQLAAHCNLLRQMVLQGGRGRAGHQCALLQRPQEVLCTRSGEHKKYC